MPKMTLGIIGLGQIGLKYDIDSSNSWKKNQSMSHASAVKDSGLFEIALLIDENENTLQLASSLFPTAKCLTLDKALRHPQPDLLIIATPTNTHLEVIQKVASSWKPKFCILEKPMGSSSNEAAEIYNILSMHTELVFVNYFRRFLPHTQNLVISSLFVTRGKLRKVSIHGYGTLKNIFSHFFDLIVFFEGAEILNLDPKVILEESKSRILFTDLNSSIIFELDGLGEVPQECKMRLEFDEVTLEVSENGGRFEIVGEGEKLMHSEYISKQEFSNYQKHAFSFICENLEAPTFQGNMLDSIKILKFIESIGSTRDKH